MTRYLTSHHIHGTTYHATIGEARAHIRSHMDGDRLYLSAPFRGIYRGPEGPVEACARCVYDRPSDRDTDASGAFAWHLADLRGARSA